MIFLYEECIGSAFTVLYFRWMMLFYRYKRWLIDTISSFNRKESKAWRINFDCIIGHYGLLNFWSQSLEVNYLSLLWLLIINELWSQFKGIFPTACLTLRSSAIAFSCSFQRITGTDCSFDRLDKSKSLDLFVCLFVFLRKLRERYFESLFSLVIFWSDSGKWTYIC